MIKQQSRTIIEVHILQTTAPGNLNRDDTGSPKSVIYGGAMRARVSSQAWKRPTRQVFRELLDPSQLGVRTKRVVVLLSKRILAADPNMESEQAVNLAEIVLTDGAGIKLAKPRKKKSADDDQSEEKLQESTYLLFMGNRQYDELASIAIEASAQEDAKATIKNSKKRIKQIIADDRSVDVALFGRMIADDTDLNVDASAQVAHAISVQEINPESDYFTAVDDAKQESEDEGDSGAAMIGDVEFNAATFYRYANVDANRLNDTLGDAAATSKAVGTFVKAFVSSMPQGKINTFAHGTLPELVVVNVRDSQAVNLVGAFERPVEPDYVEHATEALVRREQELDAAYGIQPVNTWIIRVGEDTKAAEQLAQKVSSLQEVVSDVESLVADRLSQE
jgi:CRISPR system Cascade subunit CasC